MNLLENTQFEMAYDTEYNKKDINNTRYFVFNNVNFYCNIRKTNFCRFRTQRKS